MKKLFLMMSILTGLLVSCTEKGTDVPVKPSTPEELASYCNGTWLGDYKLDYTGKRIDYQDNTKRDALMVNGNTVRFMMPDKDVTTLFFKQELKIISNDGNAIITEDGLQIPPTGVVGPIYIQLEFMEGGKLAMHQMESTQRRPYYTVICSRSNLQETELN